MNNEYYDDTMYRFNVKSTKSEQFLWTLSSDSALCPETVGKSMMPPDEGVNEKCNELFLNSSSSFEPCFSEVNTSTKPDTQIICYHFSARAWNTT